MAHRTDAELIAKTNNTARFFVENRAISWILLLAVVAWGLYGYRNMPKRKDPDIPVREAMAVCPWPGVSAAKVEELVTRKMEAKIAENSYLHQPGTGFDFGIRSVTLDGVAFVYVQLAENIDETQKQFNDINLRLNSIKDLPSGAGPIQFENGYGDTAALMLTVASPKVSAVEVSLRARQVRAAIEKVRAQAPAQERDNRASIITLYPVGLDPVRLRQIRDALAQVLVTRGSVRDLRPIDTPDIVGIDAKMIGTGAALDQALREFATRVLASSPFGSFHPDAWKPVAIEDPRDTEQVLKAADADKYTYRQLDHITDLIQRAIEGVPQVSKVQRTGVLQPWVTLAYSQDQLASYGVVPSKLEQILADRNITRSAGMLNAAGTNVNISPSGEFHDASEIGGVIAGKSSSGSPFYLRDLVAISRDYQDPPGLLNFYTSQDPAGVSHRSRAVTLAIFMRSGEQIGTFGTAIDGVLDGLKQRLPEDLIIARTSDQPRQVREHVGLFMDALYEAIILVVIVAWLGFREWRSAMLIAISMPLTLAMTFGMMFALGLDLQQVSIATLIIALGLLVDDPVVAGDAIKHDLGLGHPPEVAAWLGPTKLARPILFATITNVAAYLPFLLLKGDTYNFLYSLPIVMTCALVASRIVSMTFVPHLGYYLMRPNEKAELPIEEKRKQGFTGFYYRVGSYALNHRWQVFLGSLVFLATGAFLGQQLKTSYFPDDVQYLAFADLWLPNSAAISKTNQLEMQAERVIADAAAKYGREHPEHGKPRKILRSVTSFVGGGGPRFWFSVSPESQEPSYAQLVMEIYDKEDMPKLAGPLQEAVSAAIPGAWLDVQQLQTNPVKYPLEILISGRTDISAVREPQDIATLRSIGSQVTEILRSIPITRRIRDDWGSESPVIRLNIDADRANLAGLTNDDVAQSSEAGISGAQAGTMIEGDERIPIVARLRREQRGLIGDIKNLYVYSQTGTQKVPLQSIATLGFRMETQRIVRRDHFNTLTVFGYPATGVLPSEVMKEAQPKLEALKRTLPPGYSIQVGGEAAKQSEGFGQLTLVLVVSVALIFLALVIQFNNTVKPILVFAAVPYGAVGAIAALWLKSTPFGFMAFLGIASLVGVIVSHVIVLFEFVEEMERRGEPLVQGLLDAGIERLRPVMITVGATILALFPLAIHGGPLWQPLCFAQIGGLSLATIIELLLIKVLYSIFVRDLKILSWGEEAQVVTVKAA